MQTYNSSTDDRIDKIKRSTSNGTGMLALSISGSVLYQSRQVVSFVKSQQLTRQGKGILCTSWLSMSFAWSESLSANCVEKTNITLLSKFTN